MARHMSNLHTSRPGGGGYSECILVGVLGAGTAQKGGSRCAYSLKKGGVLGAGTARKRGVLGHGVLGTSTTRKGGNL